MAKSMILISGATGSVGGASGLNNANFATPPDGQSPRMQMERAQVETSVPKRSRVGVPEHCVE